jgi:hypothetical protein
VAEKRIVMEVRVMWVTDDDDVLVETALRRLDETEQTSPVDFVREALVFGAPQIDLWKLGLSEGSLEIRVEGPGRWAVAYDGARS